MRVPCIVRWPNHVPAGGECSTLLTSMDLFPTLARAAGTTVPAERTIDGRDVLGVLRGETQASPHDAFFYYQGCDLEAVRAGRWKLHVARGREPVEELYDLVDDVAETRNVATERTSVVAELQRHAERARADLGDERLGITGTGVREVGEVDTPAFLTVFDPTHPYYMAEYDLPHRG
jgi:arylsulfatase A-like enzyme